MTLNNIFAKSECVTDNAFELYLNPIRLKDYDEFAQSSFLLHISKNHFAEMDYPLLLLIFMSADYLKLTEEEVVTNFEKLFSLVTNKEVNFYYQESTNTGGFLVDQKFFITPDNYDSIRKIIMNQNLMFEQKVYKNKKVQEWANKVWEAKQKKNTISLEDIITTVSVYKGVTYNQIMDQTLYQLYADFYRIRKMKKYDSDIIFRSVSDNITIEDFAETIDLLHNPYDDLFVDKSKLGKLNKALGEQ